MTAGPESPTVVTRSGQLLKGEQTVHEHDNHGLRR
jgi:hypothetical protein